MPSKSLNNTKNVQKELEKTISPVLVVNNSSLKPYVELFNYAPENIYQQPLGSLVGFFEIKEYSEDSAYVVNFLTSVLKKEYYINPKRPVEESFDSALHKVNMALSELAKHGNIQWLGKLHAAICVLEQNNAHFSVTGNAKLFLYRNNGLTDISEGLASDEIEPHPLKTFVNVSSGKLEKNDRLLITSEDIFHILSVNDLKKNFGRFEGEKFVQFLKTALSNQMEMIASLIIDTAQPQPAIKHKTKKKAVNMENIFSQTTFEPTNSNIAKEAEENKTKTITESENEYTDEKTGHIYIQGEANETQETSKTKLYLELAKVKFAEGWYLTKIATRRNFIQKKKQLAKKIEAWKQERATKAKIKAEQRRIEEEERAILLEQQKIQEEEEAMLAQQEFERQEKAKIAQLEKIRQQEEEIQKNIETEVDQQPKLTDNVKTLSFQEKLALVKQQQKRSAVIDLRQKTEDKKIEGEPLQNLPEDEIEEDEYIEETIKISVVEPQPKYVVFINKVKELFNKYKKKIVGLAKSSTENLQAKRATKKVQQQDQPQKEKHFVPRFSIIKKLFTAFSTKQKLYIITGLLLVFIVPFFIARSLNKPKPRPISELQSIATLEPGQQLVNDKNLEINSTQKTILQNSNIIQTLITSADPLAITKNSVIILNDAKKEYSLPANSGSAIKATYMTDLSMVLILTDQNKVISFSPSSTKFTDNNINLPSNIASDQIGTYMTYLYVLDSKDNQIYRYPRANGGFGEKTNWYKDKDSLANVSDMTIDDSIYAIKDNQILKLFKGQAQQYNLENSKTPIKLDKLFTNLDSASLWALDKQNSRIIAFNKTDGSIVKQYFNDALKNATSFAIDEKTKTAYAVTSSGLISISL